MQYLRILQKQYHQLKLFYPSFHFLRINWEVHINEERRYAKQNCLIRIERRQPCILPDSLPFIEIACSLGVFIQKAEGIQLKLSLTNELSVLQRINVAFISHTIFIIISAV
jgi:hypothetical protein